MGNNLSEVSWIVWPKLACPKCHNDREGDIVAVYTEKLVPVNEKEGNSKVTGFDNIETYKCHCKVCDENYEVYWGKTKLRKYNPPFEDTVIGDVVVYVWYEGDENRKSYKIVSVDDVPMLIVANDDYPIILSSEEKNELINDHKKAKTKVYNTWMDRYR